MSRDQAPPRPGRRPRPMPRRERPSESGASALAAVSAVAFLALALAEPVRAEETVPAEIPGWVWEACPEAEASLLGADALLGSVQGGSAAPEEVAAYRELLEIHIEVAGRFPPSAPVPQTGRMPAILLYGLPDCPLNPVCAKRNLGRLDAAGRRPRLALGAMAALRACNPRP